MKTIDERIQNLDNFLNFIINNNNGIINDYEKYLDTIINLMNNEQIEIDHYNIHTLSNSNLPKIKELNEWKQLAKIEKPDNNNYFFCFFLWMFIHH